MVKRFNTLIRQHEPRVAATVIGMGGGMGGGGMRPGRDRPGGPILDVSKAINIWIALTTNCNER